VTNSGGKLQPFVVIACLEQVFCVLEHGKMTTENQVVEKLDTSSQFAAGFSSDEQPIDQTVGAELPTDEGSDTVEDVEAAKAVATPPALTVTPEEWDKVQRGLAEIEDFRRSTRSEFDKLGGKFGEINRAMQQRNGSTKASKEAMAKLEAEYPEVGSMINAIFAGDVDVAAPPQGAEDIERRVQERLKPELERIDKLANGQIDLGMKVYHKDWKQVVNDPAFDAWRQTLSANEAHQTLHSDDVEFAAGQIEKFKVAKALAIKTLTEKAAKQSRIQNSTKRLEAAITPQGTANAGAPTKTLRDHFREGFAN
jgi:hypothetical protein